MYQITYGAQTHNSKNSAGLVLAIDGVQDAMSEIFGKEGVDYITKTMHYIFDSETKIALNIVVKNLNKENLCNITLGIIKLT